MKFYLKIRVQRVFCIFIEIILNHDHPNTPVGMVFIKIYEYAGCLTLFGCFKIFKVFCGTLLSSGGLWMNCICSTSTYKKEWN